MTNESSKGQNTSAEETLRQRSFIELAQALTAQKTRLWKSSLSTAISVEILN